MLSRVCTATALVLFVSACQTSNTSIEQANLSITSDCVTPTRTETVTTSGGQVVSGSSYSTFGFPTNIVRLGQSVTGIVGAATRSCEHTYGDPEGGGTDFVYSCADNGSYVCSIVIKKL